MWRDLREPSGGPKGGTRGLTVAARTRTQRMLRINRAAAPEATDAVIDFDKILVMDAGRKKCGCKTTVQNAIVAVRRRRDGYLIA